MPWLEMLLRGNKVLAKTTASGDLAVEGGRVEIRYRPKDGKSYRAAARNLVAMEGARSFPDGYCAPADAAPPSRATSGSRSSGGSRKKGAAPKASAPPPHPDGALIVYADGACSGNPGPAGSGVVVLDGEGRRELSEYLGRGTNNIAELTAILRAAELLEGRDEPVHIYTDSRYSIDMLTKGWRAKKNGELIAETKDALARLSEVHFHYVPGHAGIELNERADALARAAVEARRSAGWVAA
jgi:ribonuclease HI